MSVNQRLRLWMILTLARMLRVPIAVHGSFFMFGMNVLSTPKCSTLPK